MIQTKITALLHCSFLNHGFIGFPAACSVLGRSHVAAGSNQKAATCIQFLAANPDPTEKRRFWRRTTLRGLRPPMNCTFMIMKHVNSCQKNHLLPSSGSHFSELIASSIIVCKYHVLPQTVGSIVCGFWVRVIDMLND